MYIIDIEGTDGSGKATQTQLLYEFLTQRGKKCKILSFPNYESRSSEPVKMYLNGELGSNNSLNGFQASALFAVDRLATIKTSNLEGFDFVLMDRYTPSNMIHQSTRIKTTKEVDEFLDWVEDFEYDKLGLPRPDLVLFLDVPVEISANLAHARGGLKSHQAKDILEQDDEHLKTAYRRAKYVAQKFGWQHIDCVENGNIKSIQAIHNLILNALNNMSTSNLNSQNL